MDADIFPSCILTDDHTEPSEQNRNCTFCWFWWKIPALYLYSVTLCMAPFILFLFQGSWYIQYTFLKDGSEGKN